MSRVNSHTRLIPSLLYVMDIQAYIYTCTKVLIRHGTIDASFFGVITLETEINVQSDIAINAVEDRASLHLSC